MLTKSRSESAATRNANKGNNVTKLNFSWVIEDIIAGHEAPSSEQDLVWLKQQGVLSLVRLVELDKAEVNVDQVKKGGLWDCHEPVPDFNVPDPDQIDRIIRFVDSSITIGRPVGVSCRFGQGRTGTILACYLVKRGQDATAAINEVRYRRPGSIENVRQEDAVRSYELKIRDGRLDMLQTQ